MRKPVLGFHKNTSKEIIPNPFLAREKYKLKMNNKDILSRFPT